MVKTVTLFLFALCLSITGFPQVSIYKTWIGPDLEYLDINKKITKFDCYWNFDDYNATLKHDTLKIIGLNNTSRDEPTQYRFLIKSLSQDSMTLIPLDEKTGWQLNSRQEASFVTKSTLITSAFSFESLQFACGSCFGTCPVMNLSIDSSGRMYFIGGRYTKTKQDVLQTAQLSKKQLSELIVLLKESMLDRLPVELPEGLDVPAYDFIFNYNNKKVVSHGYDIPFIIRPLVDYLKSIYKEVHLEKTTKQFKFEYKIH